MNSVLQRPVAEQYPSKTAKYFVFASKRISGIATPMEKEEPGHWPGKSPRGLSVRASRRRSVERPCDQANNGQYGADYCGDVGNSLVMVAGAHNSGDDQETRLKITTRAPRNIQSANPRRSFSRPRFISTTPAIAHWQDTRKMTKAMNRSVMLPPVHKECAIRPNRHQAVVLRIGLLRTLRALCPGTGRPEQDEHHCAID